MKKQVLIIGGGLGGLALAQGLLKASIAATLFERDKNPTSRSQGYRISIRSLEMQALSELLSIEKSNRLLDARVLDVGTGFTCANEKMETFFSAPKGQDAAIQFLRSALRALLQEEIDIKWNKRLVNFEDKQDHIVAHFQDGSTFTGDLIVGCDGSQSIVRELMSTKCVNNSIPNVVNSGRVILGGQIDRTNEWESLLPLNKTGMVRYVGADNSIGVCFSERAERSPTVYWALSDKLAHIHQDKEILLEHCKKIMRTGSWHENLQKLVEDTLAEEMMAPWIIRTTRFPETMHYPLIPSGRVTLLGDSAHAMPPDLGLGGNHVLEDARVLSSLLASSINWPKMIEQYEKEMFARAKIAISESEKATELFRTMKQ